MPGFLGGSSSGSGTGGEISFPKEFIDPVTKLRISQPENLIDTDFEYGVQPTKWETVELINNTPSFFSKSGDTTIPNITSITTNNGTREITVVTALEHGLSAGIPINVTGTKSVTADGAYIINSIPNLNTFTYLCKDNQNGNNSIEDLYTSIITGEFFQGSQLRIADAEGITTNAASPSVLTVKTDSTHGFGVNTPFYFLNLNSSISQEFEASNTAAKSFDSSNSATAQTFDGSNTLSSFNIDWSNSATVSGTVSTITSVSTPDDVITVSHTTETFVGLPIGTPLYYNVTASSGYFNTNPRGVVFLKALVSAAAGTSSFTVSTTPDGSVIDLVSAMTGTFQRANQARTFAGNNVDPATEKSLTIIKDAAITFDGANEEADATALGTAVSYSGSLITASSTGTLSWYQGTMVKYSTTGSAASGLTNNATYFVDQFFPTGGNFNFTLKALPTDGAVISVSGGSGVQTFRKIGVSTDKDIIHVRDANFSVGDMVKYTFPSSGNFTTVDAGEQKVFYFIATKYDAHNYRLNSDPVTPMIATGGTLTTQTIGGVIYNVHTFDYTGATQTFTITQMSTSGNVVAKAWGAAGGSPSSYVGGRGGVGGYGTATLNLLTISSVNVVVGEGGNANNAGANTATYGHLVASTDGGNGGYGTSAGNGGGLSGLFNGATTSQANALVIAGGGGGGGQYGTNGNADEGRSGAGGGFNANGQDGFQPGGSAGANGRGGTTSAGGAKGTAFYVSPNGRASVSIATNGTALCGGHGDSSPNWTEGGGGGSGYFGGGAGGHGQPGGAWMAAGGGSGYANTARATNIVSGTGSYYTMPGSATSDIHYSAGIGVSNGFGSKGGNGKVVIMYPRDLSL